jgi:hypothetical protein
MNLNRINNTTRDNLTSNSYPNCEGRRVLSFRSFFSSMTTKPGKVKSWLTASTTSVKPRNILSRMTDVTVESWAKWSLSFKCAMH